MNGSRNASFVVLVAAIALPALAEEGFWTFEHPPTEALRQMGFNPTPAWLERVRLASLRFMDGGSGTFVSKDGLMATNHHVALECLQNLSTKENDLVATGFYAASREKEPACPGYEVSELMGTEEVTARVLEVVTPSMTDKEAAEARKAASARLRNLCSAQTGLRCDLVRLVEEKPGARVVSLSAKDRSAIFMAGRDSRHTAYWYDQDSGRFVTSPFYFPPTPARAVVDAFNKDVGALLPAARDRGRRIESPCDRGRRDVAPLRLWPHRSEYEQGRTRLRGGHRSAGWRAGAGRAPRMRRPWETRPGWWSPAGCPGYGRVV